MKFALVLMGYEIVSFEVGIPRLGLYTPDMIPDSIEATETWGDLDD